MPKEFKFTVRSKIAPVVAIDRVADAVYVYFQRGVKVAKTNVVSEWPHVAVDLDSNGEVIGIEALCAENFSIKALAEHATVRVPKKLIESAEYKTAELAVAS